MIKGHVCIDLHNHNSGFTERIEKDNMVTNAIQDLAPFALRTYITDNNWTNYTNQWFFPIARRALGGLFLFDGKLEEDASNTRFPGNVHLVGYAGSDVTTSTNLKGSKNNKETKADLNSFTHVWDFSTSQANGKIASLSLTNEYSGNGPFRNPDSTSLNCGGGFGNIFAYNYPYIYCVEYQPLNGDVILYKKLMPLTAISISEPRIDDGNYGNSVLPWKEIYRKHLVDVDSKLSALSSDYKTYLTWNTYKYCLSGLHYYYVLVPYEAVDNYSCKLKLVAFNKSDVVNGTYTIIEIGNIPNNWSTNNYENYRFGYSYVGEKTGEGDYLKIDNTWYLVNPDTKTITQKDPPDSSGFAYTLTGNTVDVSGNTITYYDGTKVKLDSTANYYRRDRTYGRSKLFMGSWNDNNIYADLMYLGTICNLDEVVTKTESTSMKVTYTITQDV